MFEGEFRLLQLSRVALPALNRSTSGARIRYLWYEFLLIILILNNAEWINLFGTISHSISFIW